MVIIIWEQNSRSRSRYYKSGIFNDYVTHWQQLVFVNDCISRLQHPGHILLSIFLLNLKKKQQIITRRYETNTFFSLKWFKIVGSVYERMQYILVISQYFYKKPEHKQEMLY